MSRKLIVVVVSTVFLHGCTIFKNHHHIFPCPDRTHEERVYKIEEFAADAKLYVRHWSDTGTLLRASTGQRMRSNGYEYGHWRLEIHGDTIRTWAWTRYQPFGKPEDTRNTYHNILPPSRDEKWYWTLRDSLESWCGVTVEYN